jgi:eukaryotic-like serine/threonine-protein kinase
MGKHERLPKDRIAARPRKIGIASAAQPQVRYFAFLSYSHKDAEAADKLHRQLEGFRVPSSIAGRLTANGVVPKRLTPIFRDRHELAAATDLGVEIRNALAGSQFLVVLCSPDAAKSRWTNAEIEQFKKTRPEGCVLAVILSGEPFASDIAGREREECFPPALRFKFDRRGRPTTKRAEPLAADLRETGDGERLGFLKLVAGMLGIGLDELVQRETLRRQRRLAWLAAASLAGMAVTSTLAITAIQARDEARDQRRQAEGLVGFMLGDLKDKLEPIGRLDALDAVGSRALAYFQAQDKSALSDEALAQRSRALTLIGDIANTRGDLDGALRRYREAMASTEELARRYPDDPQRLFDHAQNVFWVGEIALQRGQTQPAEAAFREYKSLAERMVALQPDNRKWQLEVKYANSSLGALLYDRRNYVEASRLFQQSLRIIESLSAADPANADYQRSTVETLGWLADARFSVGSIDEAIAARERQTGLLDQLMARHAGDASFKQQAVVANQALGRLMAVSGDFDEGIKREQRATALGEQLLAAEPDNTDTIEFTAKAHFDLAKILDLDRKYDDAAAQVRSSCEATRHLLSLDTKVTWWRTLRFECALQRATLALRRNATEEALPLAQQAVSAAQAMRQQNDVDGRVAIAQAYNLIGNVRLRTGDKGGAIAAWQAALAGWPSNTAETPRQLAIRMQLLGAVGQIEEAGALRQKLNAMGYRQLI